MVQNFRELPRQTQTGQTGYTNFHHGGGGRERERGEREEGSLTRLGNLGVKDGAEFSLYFPY